MTTKPNQDSEGEDTQNMHQAMEELQQMNRENRPSTTPGAGPSKTKSRITLLVTQLAQRNPPPLMPVTQTSLKTPNTTTGHMTDRMMHATTPILTATTMKAITITRMRHSPRPQRGHSLTENPNWDIRIYTNGPNSGWPEPTQAQDR